MSNSSNLSKQFGSFDDLSEQTVTSIKSIIKMFDDKKIPYSIYYGYPVIDEKDHKEYVKGIMITQKGIFTLYETISEQDTYYSRVTQLVSSDNELFRKIRNLSFIQEISLHNPRSALVTYNKLPEIFDEHVISLANRAIQTAYGLSRTDEREIENDFSIGAKIKERNTYIGTFDEKQFNMIHSYDNKNIRVRGLAGSGKTILLAKKMAYLHFKYPEKKLAFVFFTVSLKQTIVNLFKEYYKDYDRYNEPDFTKIDIFHAWGSSFRTGFYSKFAESLGINPITFNEAQIKSSMGQDPYEYVCKSLLENILENNKTAYYDYIFVDEAQDFKINFFKLARKRLNKDGKLIYAYDELQSLSEENSIPSKTEIFGEDECVDINLETSYRAPVEILTTAHALGLGIHRSVNDNDIPFVNMIRDKNIWLDIGYSARNGVLEYGKYTELERKEEKLTQNNIINTLAFENIEAQYEELAEIITTLLINEDVRPEDILIIDLSYKLSNNYTKFKNIFNKKAHEKELYIKNTDYNSNVLAASINLVNKDNPTRIKIENSISYTTIYRAKGNEANLVFIVNSDSLELVKSTSRNKIFTAMTRARYAVWLMGLNQANSYQREINAVQSDDYILKFTYPTEEQLEKIKTYGALESVNENKIKNLSDSVSDLASANPELAKKLLAELLQNLGDQ